MENEQVNDLTKKQRNEIKREAKQKAREKSIKIKKIKSYVPWVIFILAVIGVLYWAMNAAQESEENRLGDPVEILGRNHINVGDERGEYSSNPATSGPHAGAAQWGFSEVELLEENVIHSLEHGGIWVTYKDLDDDSVNKLRDIAKRYSLSVVISPRPENDSSVTISSWGRRLELDSVDEDIITEYILKNRNKSPEQIAR